MNLFGSFILRALSILIKDALLDQMNSAQSGPHHYQGQRWVDMQVLMFHPLSLYAKQTLRFFFIISNFVITYYFALNKCCDVSDG